MRKDRQLKPSMNSPAIGPKKPSQNGTAVKRRNPDEAMAFVVEAGEKHEPTEEELILRGVLLQEHGWRYEYPIQTETKNGGRHPYRLDLYHPEARLCVEADGPFHYVRGKLRGRDRRRANRLAVQGIATLRFKNLEVRRNLAGVVEQIQVALTERLV